jgi:8-oxo-dGTP pyrophosphatase MutT (NUDIX family)
LSFVYAIAFSGRKFVMVRSRKRGLWEMPGGEVEEDETPEEAIGREFEEETGMKLEIISKRSIDGGAVFFGYARGWPKRISPEIARVELFDRLPANLAFPRKEYETMLQEAREILKNYIKGDFIVGSTSVI